MTEWMLLIPVGVLALIAVAAFAWMHHVNERYRREGGDPDPKNR